MSVPHYEGLREAAFETFESPLGRIVILATPRGVSRILLRPTKAQLAALSRQRHQLSARSRERSLLRRLREQFERYFAGSVTKFDVPLDVSSGTAFQRRVWQACRRIPYGRVRSYAELAGMAGCPRGARAVGGALNANPLPIAVPCHRVIRSDGTLGGFRWGVALKKKLLSIESRNVQH